MITVGTNGDFLSINEAVQAAQSGDTVFIRNGVYRERVEVTKPNITLIGEDNTVIKYDLYARKIVDGEKLGTFRSYTMLVNADNFTCKNITVANTAGFGDDVGQAIAVYAEGDNLTFEDCRFLGHQDTLFTGPLPFKEIEKSGFRGPTEFAERRVVHQTYKRCYVEGEVDFIFGSASAYFEECELFSINCGKEINSFVTAASTYEVADYGYIFNRCKFTSNCTNNTVYLGRPWRNFAQTALIECEIGEHIHDELFHDWNKADARNTIYYGVYGCYGKDLSGAAPFVKMLTKDEAKELLQKIKTAP